MGKEIAAVQHYESTARRNDPRDSVSTNHDAELLLCTKQAHGAWSLPCKTICAHGKGVFAERLHFAVRSYLTLRCHLALSCTLLPLYRAHFFVVRLVILCRAIFFCRAYFLRRPSKISLPCEPRTAMSRRTAATFFAIVHDTTVHELPISFGRSRI
jgi:hypothetical protein